MIRAWIVAFALLALPAAALGQTQAVSSPDRRRQIQAVEATVPPVIDGALDDTVWANAPAASGFLQADPREGEPATEDTEVRIAFDRDFLYIAALCRDRDPGSIIVNEIRKDFAAHEQDTFEVLLDTFADRRNGFVFATNAQGAKSDTQSANEGRETNPNWDAVWWVEARVTPDGWTAEFRIPFKTLRFAGGDGRTGAGTLWGINFARRVRRKNEITYWSPVSRAYSIYRASSDGDLLGLPALRPGRNLRIKPYVLGEGVRGIAADRVTRDWSAGLDLKLGVTPSLTLDATIKPDFAQAEADEQQVNLTQFSLFYPEKREFFLENSGIFYFGDIPRNQRQVSRFRPPEEDLLLFFSRRIGLNDEGEQQPLHGGLRLTGRAGAFGVGLLTMQGEGAGGGAGQNYTVARLRRDVFRSSDIGAIVVSREATGSRADFNRVAGVDTNFRFFRNLNLNAFAARSDTPGETRGQMAGKAAVGWEDSAKRLQYSVMTIGEGFRDDLGFVRRRGVTRHFFDWASMPQPESLRRRGIRQLQPHARVWNYYDPAGELVTRLGHAAIQVIGNSGATIEYAYEPRVEAIAVPFKIRPDVAIAPGKYEFTQHLIVGETDHSRALSAAARVTLGEFWSGTQKNAQVSVLYRPNSRLMVDLGLQATAIDLPQPNGSFETRLVNLRSGYAFSTTMFLDALVQYRSDVQQFSANVRFNLIHRPLSDFFIVYNEQQFTDRDVTPGRGIVVKFTQMLAF